MKVTRFLALGAVLALAACSKPAATDKPTETAATPAQPPLVTINGKAISNDLFEAYVKAVTQGKAASELTAEEREQIKEELVRMEVLAQQAEKDGLARDPDVATRLDLTRLNLLQQAGAQKYLKERQPTEAEMRAEFETQLAATPLVEYHARHILVSSQDTAQKIIDQLKAGGDFATLAKRFSGDKSTAQKGGDLGWFPPDAWATRISPTPSACSRTTKSRPRRSRRSTAGTCCNCWGRAIARRRATRACRTSSSASCCRRNTAPIRMNC